MNQEATFVAYDQFTGVTRSLFRGRIPHDSVVSYHEDLFQTEPSFRWLASNTVAGVAEAAEKGNQEVDYLGQGEGEEASYGSRLAEGAKSMMKGPWVTVFQLYGHYLDQDPVTDLPGFKSSGYGIQGAIMHPAGEVWLVGLYGAWQRLTADIRNSDAEVESGVWRLGPTFALGSGPAHAEGLITYNWGKVDNKNNSGNYSNRQWDLFVRGGYDFDMEHMARGLTLTPELQALYSNQSRDAFNWQYDNTRINSASSSGWATRLGGTLGYDRLQFEQPLEFKLSVGWQYNQYTTADLETSDGTNNGRYGFGEYDRHAMYYAARVDTVLNETFNVSFSYAGTWSSNALGHFLQAGVEFRF